MPTPFPFCSRLAAVALLLPCLGLSTPAASHDASKHSGTNLSRLGKVEFKVECNAAAQQEFNRAMALYHSFAWHDAHEGRSTASPRPTRPAAWPTGAAPWRCSTIPFIWPGNLPPAKLNDVAAALDAARKAGLKSQREKDYVEAVAVFVRDHEKVNHPTRLNAFDDAMGKLAARYPDDKEASILSALITSANFNPADKTYANQLKAAKILEPLFVAQPDHPGVAHYLIHSYDYPPIAKQGLAAAKRYADDRAGCAARAAHAVAHLHARRPLADSIEANRASAKAAGDATFDAHHAYDYMVYAHLQLGQDKAAREALKQSRVHEADRPFRRRPLPTPRCPRAWRSSARTGSRRRAIALCPKADAYPWSRYPQAEAINAFARGVGCGAERRRRRRQDGARAAAGAARRGQGAQARLLGGADRHPGRRRQCA